MGSRLKSVADGVSVLQLILRLISKRYRGTGRGRAARVPPFLFSSLSAFFSHPFVRFPCGPLRVFRTVRFSDVSGNSDISGVVGVRRASCEFRTSHRAEAACGSFRVQEPNSPQSRSLRSPEVSRKAGLTRTTLVACKARPRRRAADARAFRSPSSFRVPRNPRNRRIPRFLSILLASAAPTAQTNPHFGSDTGGVHSKNYTLLFAS